MQAPTIVIRPATDADFDGIWAIFHAVVRRGDTYAYAPETCKEEAHAFWMPPQKETFVALHDAVVVGTYFIKPNQPGLGAHVANAAYMVHPEKRGYRIGQTMAEHSLVHAKNSGYQAMQFNFVLSNNLAAVRLWKKMGFTIIGTTPKGFLDRNRGYIDTYIMHKFL
jgi:L-amino acid N-acyltransferase YncA